VPRPGEAQKAPLPIAQRIGRSASQKDCNQRNNRQTLFQDAPLSLKTANTAKEKPQPHYASPILVRWARNASPRACLTPALCATPAPQKERIFSSIKTAPAIHTKKYFSKKSLAIGANLAASRAALANAEPKS
jgi:hypothetical protein